MKKLTSLLFTVIFTISLSAQTPGAFATTWDVAANDVITIPLQSGTYNFTFEWTLQSNPAIQISGTHTNADGDFTTNFVDPGTYELEITGAFPHMTNYPVAKLLDVLQWGNIQWGNMSAMFQDWDGAGFTATDAPDLSQVTSLILMFFNASNFNEDLDHWDVSNITSLGFTFRNAFSFDGNISNWDVSNVTVLLRTFQDATNFNQDISAWEVGQVVNMQEMFNGATNFNQPIGNWNVSSVTNLREMLLNASSFNQPLGGWVFNPALRNNINNVTKQVLSGNAFDCESWSSTIIGWNLNNPTLDSLLIGGPNVDYDPAADMARDTLVARGWTINGTNIRDCNPCPVHLTDAQIGSPIESGLYQASDTISSSGLIIDGNDVIFDAGVEINLLPDFEVESGALFETLLDGCD